MRVLLLKNLTDRLGRKYSKEELLYNLMRLDKPLIGEFGFDNSSSSISLGGASHEITDIRFEDNDLYGDVTVIKSHAGRILAEIMIHCPENIRFGIRATGNVDSKNCVSDLDLITFDIYLDSDKASSIYL